MSINSGGSHPLDQQEIEQLKAELAEAREQVSVLKAESKQHLRDYKASVEQIARQLDAAARRREEDGQHLLKLFKDREHDRDQLAWLRGQVQTLRGLCDGMARMDGYDEETANVTVREIRRVIDMQPAERDETDEAESADCGCPVIRKQAVITTHTRECSTAQQVASFRAHVDDEYPDDDGLSTPEVGHVTPQFLADVAVVERLSGVPNVDMPLDDDAELADINARVAADKRVLDAADRFVAAYRATTVRPLSDAQITAVSEELATARFELIGAVDARRALTGEQTAGA